VDMSSAMLGDMSTITDSGTGDSVVLMHKSKTIMKMSGAQVKQVMEAMRKQMGNGAATNAMALKPVATGKTEKVGDYNTEIYTWTNSRGMGQILWVAKDFPGIQQDQRAAREARQIRRRRHEQGYVA